METIRIAVQHYKVESELYKCAADAAFVAVEDFKHLPNKVGRAGMFGQKSVGLPDPGMVAVARIIG